MATESKAITPREERGQTKKWSFPAAGQSSCVRCGGLMVPEFCMDLLNSTGELDCEARRCVQCGEVVDSLVLQNRRTQHEAVSSRRTRVSQSVRSMSA
jgi:hypothetical protein